MGAQQATLRGYANVQVAVDKQSYTAGEVINGYVAVEVLQPTTMSNINVSFTGSAKTVVHYTTTSGAGDNQTTHHHTAKDQLVVVNLVAAVAHFPDDNIAPGNYQFPFQFVIPPTAPTTLQQIGASHGNHCELSYSVSVSCIRPGWTKSNLVHAVPLFVFGRPEGVVGQNRLDAFAPVVSCCCLSAGDVNSTLITDKRAYAVGEGVQISVGVANNSASALEPVTLEIQQHISFSAKGHHCSSIFTKFGKSIISPLLPKGEVFGGSIFQTPLPGTPLHSSDPIQTMLMIPPSAHHTCKLGIITVTTSVVLHCQTSYFRRNAKIALEITLYRGTPAPFQQGPPPQLQQQQQFPHQQQQHQQQQQQQQQQHQQHYPQQQHQQQQQHHQQQQQHYQQQQHQQQHYQQQQPMPQQQPPPTAPQQMPPYPPSLPSEPFSTATDLPPPAYNQAVGYAPPPYVPDPTTLGSNVPAVGVDSTVRSDNNVFSDVDAWQKQNWKSSQA